MVSPADSSVGGASSSPDPSSASNAISTRCSIGRSDAPPTRPSQNAAKTRSNKPMSSGRRTRTPRPAQYTALRRSMPTAPSASANVMTEPTGTPSPARRSTTANVTAIRKGPVSSASAGLEPRPCTRSAPFAGRSPDWSNSASNSDIAKGTGKGEPSDTRFTARHQTGAHDPRSIAV